MQFECPACRHPITANVAKPGKFRPKCPKCSIRIVILIQVGLVDEETLVEPAPKRPAPKRSAPLDAPVPKHVLKDDPDATFAGAPGKPTPDATFAGESAAVDATQADETADFDPAPPPKKPGKKVRAAADDGAMPAELGGYEILKQLGKGGMGAVYLARQMSLDRAVALKVMNAEWADDPVFIARFVREAYAAAQLTHHNVVQIYDIGQDANVNYFSMEYVEGRSLGEVLKKSGRVPTDEAVGYIVQAARGLKFAHDRGMVHRDIKPDNLMLNGEGIVKVSDLGLVKTRGMTAADDAAPDGEVNKPGSMLKQLPNVTNVGTAMGSPAYMAPEQCRDASAVDHRADVYSLGCSLYALLCGRAPFTGATAVQVITMHLNEPPPPLRKVLPTCPKGIAEIVDKTLEKNPDDRYQSMDEFIDAVKVWQGGEAAGPPRPTEEQLAAFEYLLGRMKIDRAAKLERFVGRAVPALGILAALVAIPFSTVIAGGILVGTVAALASMFVCSGLFAGSHAFVKVREWASGARIVDWLGAVVGALLLGAILYFAGLLWAGLAAIAVGALLGVANGFLIAKPARDRRLDIKDEFEKILKRLRLIGMEEDGVRLFVVGTAGDRWEDVYELLYGYPAKIAARTTYAAQVANRPKGGAWRDGPLAKIDARLEARRQAKAKTLLRKMEAARYRAEGLSPAEANARGADDAENLVEQAVEIKAANLHSDKTVNVFRMMTAYERGRMDRAPRKRKNPLTQLVKLVLDPRWRMLAGAALLVVGLMGFKAGAKLDAAPADAQATAAASKSVLDMIVAPEKYKPLGWLPPEIAPFFVGVNALVAGLLLILSGFTGRTLAILGIALAAALAFVGHQFGLPIPTFEVGDGQKLQPGHLTAAGGLLLGLLMLALPGRKVR